MATKTATKKASTKKAKRNAPAWMKTLPAIIKIRYKGEQLAQKDFYEARANTMKLEANQVADMFRAISTGQEEVSIPDDVDKATATRINKAWAALQKDWKAHKAAVDGEKQAEEDSKKAKEEAKESAVTAMALVEKKEGSKLVRSFTKTVDDNVAKIVGQYFDFDADHGSFTLKDGVELDDEVIAETLGKLSMMSGAAEDISSQAALREAQFVRCIREKRPDWAIFFDGREKDLKRIKQYVKCLDVLDEYKQMKVLETIPFSTLRPALETRFSKDAEENDKKKKEAIKAIYQESVKAKKPVPQLRARNIIADIKGGGEVKKQLKAFYVFILPTGEIKVCGSEKLDDRLMEGCTIMIDRGTGKFTMRDDDGNWEAKDIVGPDEDVIEYINATVEDAPAEEVEEEETEEEVDDSEQDFEPADEEETEEEEWEEEAEEEGDEEEAEEEEEEDDWE